MIGAPGRGRTLNLQIRSLTLYPIELRAHVNIITECINLTSSEIACPPWIRPAHHEREKIDGWKLRAHVNIITECINLTSSEITILITF
jgi:hypothetical protein